MIVLVHTWLENISFNQNFENCKWKSKKKVCLENENPKEKKSCPSEKIYREKI